MHFRDRRRAEMAWDFTEMPPAEQFASLVDALARTMPVDINATALLDDAFKERRPRYAERTVHEFLDSSTWTEQFSVLAYARVRGEDNRLPRAMVSARRVPYRGADLFALSVSADAEDAPTAPRNWIELVADRTDWRYGCGGTVPVSIELDYFAFLVSGLPPGGSCAAHAVAVANIRRADRSPADFIPVTEGKMLRGVFAENLVSVELFDRIRSGWGGPLPGAIEPFGTDLVLWAIAEPADRSALHERLAPCGLVFDEQFFDPSTYVPQIDAFSVPFAPDQGRDPGG